MDKHSQVKVEVEKGIMGFNREDIMSGWIDS
jgi:hypothetical protein